MGFSIAKPSVSNGSHLWKPPDPVLQLWIHTRGSHGHAWHWVQHHTWAPKKGPVTLIRHLETPSYHPFLLIGIFPWKSTNHFGQFWHSPIYGNPLGRDRGWGSPLLLHSGRLKMQQKATHRPSLGKTGLGFGILPVLRCYKCRCV